MAGDPAHTQLDVLASGAPTDRRLTAGDLAASLLEGASPTELPYRALLQKALRDCPTTRAGRAFDATGLAYPICDVRRLILRTKRSPARHRARYLTHVADCADAVTQAFAADESWALAQQADYDDNNCLDINETGVANIAFCAQYGPPALRPRAATCLRRALSSYR